MSRIGTPGAIVVRPTNNVYTALAFIAAAATLTALVFLVLRLNDLGALPWSH